MRTRTVRLDGDLALPVSVHTPEDETGPPVLLLHGFPSSARTFDGVVPDLVAAGRRTLAPDQRGYTAGARPVDVDAYRLPRLVADAVAVLDALDVEVASVVGHDWGAVVAWALAASHPERVADLTAVSVPHPRAYAAALVEDRGQQVRSAYIGLLRRRGMAERVLLAGDRRLLRATYAGSGLDREAVEARTAHLRTPDELAGALAWYRALRRGDLTAVAPVAVPTTYVWSDRDVAVARGTAERCAAHVEAPYRFVPLHGVSHWVPEQRPQAVVGAVLDPPRA